jgi:hypothetical protein
MAKISCWRVMLVVAGLLIFGGSVGAQSAAGAGPEQIASAKAVPGIGAGAAGAAPAGSQAGTQAGGQTGTQSPLALQTEKLVAMATELKVRVDKTNKDILSWEVVRQAQEIERYAHQMKQSEVKK